MPGEGPPEGSEHAYEAEEASRPASGTPTEPLLESEAIGKAAAGARPAARVDMQGADGRPVETGPYAALKYRAYRIFSAGWMLSVIGNRITFAALGWQLYKQGGDKDVIGWFAGVQAIPLILLALPAGALADMFDRRKIIAITAVLAAACSVGLAFVPVEHPSGAPESAVSATDAKAAAPAAAGKEAVHIDEHYRWMAYLLLGLNATFLTLGRPARSSLLPATVPLPVFTNAVTWNASFFQTASIVGPPLGGLILGLSQLLLKNGALAYCTDAALMLAFAGSMLLLPKPPPLAQKGPTEPMLKRIATGIRFVWKTRIILATLSLDLFAVLLGGAVYLLPVFAKDILHVGEFEYSMLLAADAVGALTMAVVIAHTPPIKRAGRGMLVAVAGFGAATIIFGLSSWFWLSFAALLFVGALDNISVVVRHTLVQVLTPDEMRGRVSAVNNIFIGTSNEIGGVESSFTAKWFGAAASVIYGGIGTIIVVFGIGWLFPEVRALGSLQDVATEAQAKAQRDRDEAAAALAS